MAQPFTARVCRCHTPSVCCSIPACHNLALLLRLLSPISCHVSFFLHQQVYMSVFLILLTQYLILHLRLIFLLYSSLLIFIKPLPPLPVFSCPISLLHSAVLLFFHTSPHHSGAFSTTLHMFLQIYFPLSFTYCHSILFSSLSI